MKNWITFLKRQIFNELPNLFHSPFSRCQNLTGRCSSKPIIRVFQRSKNKILDVLSLLSPTVWLLQRTTFFGKFYFNWSRVGNDAKATVTRTRPQLSSAQLTATVVRLWGKLCTTPQDSFWLWTTDRIQRKCNFRSRTEISFAPSNSWAGSWTGRRKACSWAGAGGGAGAGASWAGKRPGPLSGRRSARAVDLQ